MHAFSPAHQYAAGAMLAASRRAALLNLGERARSVHRQSTTTTAGIAMAIAASSSARTLSSLAAAPLVVRGAHAIRSGAMRDRMWECERVATRKYLQGSYLQQCIGGSGEFATG